jgi:hypothetical protein
VTQQLALVPIIFREEFRLLTILLAAMAVGLVVKEIKLSRHTSLGQNSTAPAASNGWIVGWADGPGLQPGLALQWLHPARWGLFLGAKNLPP